MANDAGSWRALFSDGYGRRAQAVEPTSATRTTEIAARALTISVFATFLAYYVWSCFRYNWSADFQLYCAAVARLYRGFQSPTHEAANVPGTLSTAYTVWLTFWAWLGHAIGIKPYRALQLAGICNLFIFCASVGYFFSRHSLHRRWWLASACFLLVTLFVRWNRFGWSSELAVSTLTYTQSYPSTLGWALGFTSLGLSADVHRSPRPVRVLLLASVLAILLLTHILTASWVLGIVTLHALVRSVCERNTRPLLHTALSIALAIALTFAWPYSSYLHQGSVSTVAEGSKFGRNPFADVLNLYLLVIPCAVFLLGRLRVHGFFVLGFFATWAALLTWRLLGISFGNRYTFFMAFFAQFLLAEGVTLGFLALWGKLENAVTHLQLTPRDRVLSLVLLFATIAATLPSPMLAAARATGPGTLYTPAALLDLPSPYKAYYARFKGVRSRISADDLVLMPSNWSAYDLVSLTGAHVVIAPNALDIPDRLAREADVKKFFHPKTAAKERMAIATRYGATKVLLTDKELALVPTLTRTLGAPVYKDEHYALFALKK